MTEHFCRPRILLGPPAGAYVNFVIVVRVVDVYLVWIDTHNGALKLTLA